MNVLGIVPARGGSEGIAQKNLQEIGDTPLVVRALRAARAAKRIDQVIVSTDDDAILACAVNEDPECGLKRPAQLATDTSPAIDYVRHALSEVSGNFDAVALVLPTSPFTEPDDIDRCIDRLKESGADSVVTVRALDHAIQPAKIKRMEGDRLVPYFEDEGGRMAKHELPELYVRNAAVYVTRVASIEAGDIIGPDCRGVLMPPERSVDINDPLDLAFARFLAQESS